MKFLKQLVIIIFIFCSNSGYTQTWSELEKKIENYSSAKDYNKAFEISIAMENYAKSNTNDSSATLATALFYKLVFSIYSNQSDTVMPYYSYKITNELSKLAYGKYFIKAKPVLINFISFLRAAKIESTWMYPMYNSNICALARIYKMEGYGDDALELYKEVLDIYSVNSDKGEAYCGALLAYSNILYNQKKYSEAESNLNVIFSIYDSLGSVSGYFNATLSLYSTVKIVKGEYDQAIKMFNKYIPKYGNYEVVGIDHFFSFYSSLAYLNELVGEYKTAETIYNKINEIKGLDDWDYLHNLNNYALLLRKIENFQKSETLFTKSLKLHKDIFGIYSEEYAATLNDFGNLYVKIGNYENGERLIIEAVRIRKSLLGEDSPIYAASLADLAVIYINIGYYSKAEDIILQSLKIRQKTFGRNSTFVAENYNDLGHSCYKQKKYTLAEFYYNKAIEVYKSNKIDNSPLLALYLSNLATLYTEIKDYNKAETLQLRAMEIRKLTSGEQSSDYANSCANIANVYIHMNDFSNAEKMYLLASKIYLLKFGEFHEYYLNNLDNLAYAYEVHGDYIDAFKLNEQIFSNRTVIINRNFKWLSQIEREQYWNNESVFYSCINNFVSKAYKNIPASSELSYNASLISKSLLLSTSIQKNISLENSDKINLDIYYNLKNNRILLSKLTSEGSNDQELISELEHNADSLDQLLSRKLSTYNDYKKNFVLNWKDIQSNLNKDEASIEFAEYIDDKDTTKNYMALIIRQGDKYPQAVKLCSEDNLKQFSTENELGEIYTLIWKPITEKLDGIKTIYYTPEGLLNNIPFQALYNEKDGNREYLMDKYSMNQLTSSRYLALGLKKKALEKIESSIALFGGINYNEYPNAKKDTTNHEQSNEAAFLYKNAVVLNRELDSNRTGANYLPGTKKEVETISNVLKSKQWQVDISEEKNATENKIKSLSGSNSKAILHIATHGFAFPDKEEKRKDMSFSMMRGNDKYKASDNPMIRSGLLFGGANITWQGKGDSLLNTTNEDGVLTAYELSQLDLSNTKLAVLSACETGKGEIQGSEGTFGLKRALKLAGVDNMIVSLWKVPDDATMEMMTLFYTELANTKKPVSSFETAQKAMRLKYPNEPKKWAGFVFVR